MDIKASCCIRRPDSARTWSQNKAEALKIKLVSFYVAAFRNNFYFCCYTSTTGRCYMCKNENLYVDEVLAVLDDVDVGIVDGLFMVFDASRPIWSWAQDLREHRLAMGISHRLCFLSLRGNFTDKIYYLFMFISAFTKKVGNCSLWTCFYIWLSASWHSHLFPYFDFILLNFSMLNNLMWVSK